MQIWSCRKNTSVGYFKLRSQWRAMGARNWTRPNAFRSFRIFCIQGDSLYESCDRLHACSIARSVKLCHWDQRIFMKLCSLIPFIVLYGPIFRQAHITEELSSHNKKFHSEHYFENNYHLQIIFLTQSNRKARSRLSRFKNLFLSDYKFHNFKNQP